MITEPRKKKLKNLLRKKVVRFITFAFLGILFLEFTVYFVSNILLSNWARQKINEKTKGIYEIEFNRVNLSLIRRGIFLDGIILKPIDPQMDNSDQALFDLYLDELAIRGLWYNFTKGVFSIGKIELDNPNLSLDFPEKEQLIDRSDYIPNSQSRVKALESELKKSIDRLNIAGVYIHEIEIINADLFFLNFLSENSLQAENTSLVVKDIDWTTRKIWNTPFNARGFEFNLENVDFPLPDGVHTLSATTVRISSLENKIDLREVRLTPDRSKESKAYYEVSLKDLRIGNVDLNTAFMTSKVLIDEIILARPDFKVERREDASRNTISTGDLNELIDGVLESIEVKELSIVRGSFLTSDYKDSLKNRIEIKDLNFNMIKFYLGNDSERQKNQFFYGEDASMNIKEASLYLSDDIHVIYGEQVSLSSFKDELIIENVRVEPRVGYLEALDRDNIIQVSLPKLALNNVNLKQFYNDGKLKMDEMIIDSPKVEFKELNQKEKRPFKEGKASELLKGYMDEVSIGKLQLNDGEVQFTDEAGVRSNDIEFERFSLLLEKVMIRPNLDNSIQEIFLADEMVLSMDKYRLKLRDNLHEFLADEILIDSKNSRIVVKDFSLKPENPKAIQAALDAYEKTVVINIEIPEFRIEGIDLQTAFWDEKLIIGQILIPSPKAELSRFRKKKGDSNIAEQLNSADEFKTLLTSYFSYIQIDSVSFSDGQIKYENFSGSRNISLSEDSLALTLKGFLIDKGVESEPNRTFFSEEIDLSLLKYSFNVAGGSYEVDTDGVKYNSKSKTIIIDSLRLFPLPTIKSKLAIEVKFPSVSFKGVDLQSFLFDNKLIFDELSVNGSEIALGINQGFNSSQKSISRKNPSSKALPKEIEEIQIAKINALDSKLILNYLTGKSDAQSIKTNFDLEVRGLRLDSATSSRENFTGLFDDVSLKLENFSFALPDSIHTLKFTSVNVNNKEEETVFSNFEVAPTNTTGNKGNPIFAAKIKEVGIRHNSLANIESTGIVDLSRFRLTEPQIDIYLDAEDKENTNSISKTPKENALVSSIILRDLLLQSGDIRLHNKETGLIPKLAFANVDFGINDLNLDLFSTGTDLTPKFLLEKDLSLSLANYQILTKDSLNKLRIGKIKFSGKDVVMENIFYGPTVGQYEYMRRIGYQTDAITAFVERISLSEIDFDAYFKSNLIKAKKIELQGADLDVFRDKRIARREEVIKPMPQELMFRAPFNLQLDSVILKDATIAYQEFAPRAMMPGFIRFEKLNAQISPFVLAKSEVGYPLEKAVLTADAKIMGDGQLNLKSVYYFEPPYLMEMDISLGEFDLTLINSILSPGVFVSVEEGRVTGGKWDFKMNEDEAWGKMNFNYKDLKIQLLDTVSMQKGKGKLGFMTFLANTFAKNSNPRKLFNRQVTATIYHEREKNKFIFGGWWRATFSGLKGSLGFGQVKIPKRKEEIDE